MRMPRLMQRDKGLLDIGIDPGFLSVFGIGGAGCNDLGKGLVGGHLEPVLTHRLGQRVRDMQSFERQDCALLRFNPEGRGVIARIRHRENAVCIGPQHHFKINRQRARRPSFRVTPARRAHCPR